MLEQALSKGKAEGALPPIKDAKILLETPRHRGHGDLSSSIAFLLAKESKSTPHDVANSIVKFIPIDRKLVDRIEVAGPGFINFFIAPPRLHKFLQDFEDVEFPDIGGGKKILIEFASANPTGPLHVGHGRGAALGDVLANLLEATGFKVEREYYINDVGNQIQTLGHSLKVRYLELIGVEADWPPDGYQGEYLVDIAKTLFSEKGSDGQNYDLTFFSRYALKYIIDEIKTTLTNFGVRFTFWISEEELHKTGELDKVIQALKEKGLTYEQEGALWFKASSLGDEKDRVLIRESGEPTYFAGDLTYHLNKYSREYEELINIWGQDHHGYAPRIKAALSAFNLPEGYLKIILYQMVSLLREGRPVAMSTRQGEFVTLDEVLKEVGRDAARFYFLMQSPRAHLDFDLELAKKKTADNPVFYIQYAHARISSIFAQAEKKEIEPFPREVDLAGLGLKEELNIITKLEGLSEEIVSCAKNYEPQRLTTCLIELASMFHSYYNHHRIISQDVSKTAARLVLIRAIQMTIKRVLEILGVSAPEKM